MPADGKLRIGELLPDWQAPKGYVTEIVAISSGKLPTPIDTTSPMRGSSAEACALFGGSAGSAHSTKPKGQQS